MTKSEDNLLSMDHYVRKTFFKTASLMANSCRAVAILGGGDDVVSQAAWDYGRNLGLAFQVPGTCEYAATSPDSVWCQYLQAVWSMLQSRPTLQTLVCQLRLTRVRVKTTHPL